ncbi:MAG: hypothetical protein ACE5NG_10020 [bacterium]
MRRMTKHINLTSLEKSHTEIKAESPHSAKIELNGYEGKILIEPDKVLYGKLDNFIENGSIVPLPQWLVVQSKILAPVKFVCKEPPGPIDLVGELPLQDGQGLEAAFTIIKEGMVHAGALKKGVSEARPYLSKGSYSEYNQISVKGAEELIEGMLKARNYEVTYKAQEWTIALNTALYFQKIRIFLDEGLQCVRLNTKLIDLKGESSLQKLAMAAFLLHAAARLRFVRACLNLDENSEQEVIALEVVLPWKCLKIFKPEIALESLIVATRYTKLPCEALLQKQVAERYLQNWCGETWVNSN